MGLYLCIFDEDEELDGVEVGPYEDFNSLRNHVVREFEGGIGGSRYPTFIIHSDCDGDWSVSECVKLGPELAEIATLMKNGPPVPFVSVWQAKVAKSVGLVPQNAFECFIDVDGEFVIDRIRKLVTMATDRQLPILFQ